MPEASTDLNPEKVRIGLAVVAITFLASIVLFFVVDDTIGQAVFFSAAILALGRLMLLVGWLRRRPRGDLTAT